MPPALSAWPHRGSRAAPHRRRLRSAEFRRRRQSACHQGSSRLQPRTSAVPSPGPAPSIALCGCAWTTLSRAFARTTKVGLTAGVLSCRQATLGSDLYSEREPPPEKQKKSPRRSHEKALGSDQHSWRPTDKVQTLFLEPWSSTWLRSTRFLPTTLSDPGTYHLLSGGERLRGLQFPR